MTEQKQQCDGRAGCTCADCRRWDEEAKNEHYGYQKWLSTREPRK